MSKILTGGGQKPPAKQRESNLDLLRGLCAVFVVFEHFCETSAHNAFGYTLNSSMPAHILLRLMYGIARTAVPVFFLLSGYLSINSQKQKLGKVINLFIMTGVYSFIPYFASCLNKWLDGEGTFSIYQMIRSVFPQNYYLYLFCALYTFSPFLNQALKNLSRKNYQRLCIILFLLFSLWSTLINTLNSIMGNMETTGWYFTSRTGTSMGFNIAIFTMMYIIGGYLHLYYKPNKRRDVLLSLVILLCSTSITTVGKIITPTLAKAFLYYDSVFVILPAVAMMILFINIHVKQNKLITFMGVHTFGTFLIHGFANNCIEKLITIENVVSTGFTGAMLGVLIFVIGVYILVLFMTSILELIATPINKKWKAMNLYNFQFWYNED